MEQNIETKDVQRTEYLDKNGLDMLWAKIKENTHNQVEVERNRAVAKENSIIDTKADKSTLDNYVLTTALAEYAKKTDIPAVDTSDFVSKTTTDDQIINSTLGIVGGGGIQIVEYTQDGDPVFMTLGSSVLNFDGNNRSTIELNSSDVDSNNGSYIVIEAYNENPQITLGDRATFRNNLTITKEGISSTDNNANRVYATDGSIADLTQYALKTELPTAGIPYNPSVTNVYQTDKQLAVKLDDENTANFGPNSCIRLKSGETNNLVIDYISMSLKSGINTFNVNPTQLKQVTGSYMFNVNSSDGIKWSTPDNAVFSQINPYGLFSKIQSQSYTNCNNNNFLDIKSGNNKINVNPTLISATNGTTRIEITPENLTINDGNNNIQLYKGGIFLPNGDNNHVLTSRGSTIDISQYAKKTDLPKMKFVSSLPETTDSNTLYFVI